MTAHRVYYLAFFLIPGLFMMAAVWYFRFSAHYHRGKRTRGVAIVRASLETAVVSAILGWLLLGSG